MKLKLLFLTLFASVLFAFKSSSQNVTVLYDNGSNNNVTCPIFFIIDNDENYSQFNVPAGVGGAEYMDCSHELRLGVDPGTLSHDGWVYIYQNYTLYTVLYLPANTPGGAYASNLPYQPGDTWAVAWID